MPRHLKSVPQLALDEEVVENTELEAALNKRLQAKDNVAEVKAVFEAADVAAKALLAPYELEEGSALRIGRFRITKVTAKGHAVSFETHPKPRLVIGLVEE